MRPKRLKGKKIMYIKDEITMWKTRQKFYTIQCTVEQWKGCGAAW